MAMSGGLPSTVEGHHCIRMIHFAKNIIKEIELYNKENGKDFQVQIGLSGKEKYTNTK